MVAGWLRRFRVILARCGHLVAVGAIMAGLHHRFSSKLSMGSPRRLKQSGDRPLDTDDRADVESDEAGPNNVISDCTCCSIALRRHPSLTPGGRPLERR
jgi:hypothetical protein